MSTKSSERPRGRQFFANPGPTNIPDSILRAVGNVTIHANSESGSNAYTTRTDKTGAYVLHGVVPDMYDLTVRSMDRLLIKEHVPISHVRNFVRMDLRLIQV